MTSEVNHWQFCRVNSLCFRVERKELDEWNKRRERQRSREAQGRRHSNQRDMREMGRGGSQPS